MGCATEGPNPDPSRPVPGGGSVARESLGFIPWEHEHRRWHPGPGAPRAGHDGTVWLSPRFASTAGWDEVLVSWNVDVPRDVRWRLELEVTDAKGGSSPWLFLGSWEGPTGDEAELDPSLTEVLQGCELGEVAVDVFQATNPIASARLRAVAEGERHASVRFARCDLIGSTRLGDSAQTSTWPGGMEGSEPADDGHGTRGPSGPWPAALDVPLLSQRSLGDPLAPRTCSPTSVSMVLGYRGLPSDARRVAQACFDRRFDLYGNWPRNVQAAYALGCPGRLARIGDWAEVRDWIERGVPVICSIGVRPGELEGAPYGSTGGHLVVLCGFTPDGDVVVADPAASPAEGIQRVYRREQFERVWMVRGGTAYLLGTED